MTFGRVASPSAQSHRASDNIVSTLSHRKGMTIVSLNLNSLLIHIDEIRTFIQDLVMYILAISETKLDGNFDDALVSTDSSSIRRCDRNRNSGGGAFCIKYSIVDKCSIGDDLPESSLESLCIEDKPIRGAPFLVFAWHRAPYE